MRPFRFAAVSLFLVLVNLPASWLPNPESPFTARAAAAAQLRVKPVAELPDDVALRLMLRKLASSATFMATDAHPDDEDNPLLAMMSHGRGMRTVLVTATRGDGGQNEIGPEIFTALGVLRTEELLAVHRFDGAEQYFTRAIDFGYSFSIDESIEKWGHDEIVADFVRHIRTIRPDVIAGFLCSGESGGLHHQASARLTTEAFRAAADPAKFPEQLRDGLRPWQAKRVFCTEGFNAAGGRGRGAAPAPASRDLLTVRAAIFDPLLGRTYTELGLEARSMHKCQGTSQLLALPGGGGARTYRLQDSVIGEPGVAPDDLFSGIDTTLTGLAAYAGAEPPAALAASLQTIAADVAAAVAATDAKGPAAGAQPIAAGLGVLRDLRAKLGSMALSGEARYEIEFRLAQKEAQFQSALLLTHGIRLEALADDGTVVAGQPVKVSIAAGNNGPPDVGLTSVSLAGFAGSPAACTGPIQQGGAASCTADVRIAEVPLSTPYWKARADAARYDFEPGVPFGLAFTPTPFRATFRLSIGGTDVTVDRPVEYRYSDLFAGEKRMELQVVPAFSVRVTPTIAVVTGGPAAVPTTLRGAAAAAAGTRTRRIQVAVSNNLNGAVTAAVTLSAPSGWQVTPASAPVTFGRQDEDATVQFTITAGPAVAPGDYGVDARVASTTDAKVASASGYEVVEYPHIHRRHVIEPAHARVKVMALKIAPGLRVGYVMGVGDDMPAAIEQLGAAVHLIDPIELASGDLSGYNAVVTGVRAYERRPDLRANNGRLLQYVENGGLVLVNYNKQEFNQAQYGPFPAKNGTDRVTDENAAVDILVPDHPVFNTPNRITAADWSGWVQERGTYFLSQHDPRYVDLVRMTDPFPSNPGSKIGGLVEGRFGKGRWLYLGLGLWRQLPAGTDGAYKLMANLLSLGAK